MNIFATMQVRLTTWLLVGAVCLASPFHAGAAGVVGNGTPASCTEAALDVALAGGGIVTFDCGGAPHAIIVTGIKDIADDTEIDGGGTITLSGGNATPFFQVFSGVTAEIDDITLALGFGTYGAIQNFGTLTIADSKIENCSASVDGGAISNYSVLHVVEGTEISGNQSAGDGGGIFNDGATVTIADSQISHNETTQNLGTESGGGIFSNGTLTITGSTVSDNTAVFGGGIFSSGTLVLTDSVVQGNDVGYAGPTRGAGLSVEGGTATVTATSFIDNDAGASSYGGGVYVGPGPTVTIEDSTFTQNSATSGGGLVNSGTATVTRSTFTENSGFAAAIGNGITGQPGVLTMTNVTVSGNTATGGTAVYLSDSDATLQFVTIASNTGGVGSTGGLHATGSVLSIKSSIVAGNTPADCDTFTSGSEGFNIVGDSSCLFGMPTDENATDPLLGPLADNGGPTLTHLPDPLSPAIDGGQCDGVTDDQRGVTRPQGLACDIGAVEVAPTTTTTITTTTSLGGTTTTTLPSGDACGDPVALVASRDTSAIPSAAPRTVTASDALAVLNAAVGLFTCELCVCDVDASGSIAATDALITLQVAVGLSTELLCPACS